LYEVGAILQLHEEANGDFHFDLARTDLELETSNNLDLSLRKFEGNFGFIINAFYNQIDNYYYLSETNAVFETEHDHGTEEGTGHDHEHTAELPVYIYQARDVDLYGFEGEANWQVSAPLKLSFTTDYTRAQLKDGGDLPRIPPLRIGASAEYKIGNWRAELSGQHYFEQDKIAALETTTDAYTLLDAQISYAFSDSLKIYLKGNNLTDEYARVHASFLKDKAPLPARSYALGISGRF
jgi:iron complex outermembrane recepter protein